MAFSISPYAPGQAAPLYTFGNQESEEEKKRREREAIAARMEQEAQANPIAPVAPTPVKETRTIDPTTGETKIKIEGTERDLSTANPNTPTLSTAQAPVNPDDYNRRIARLESGANPNIGYHDRNKSSAYGTYGLTNAAYQDARRANPNLPADIAQSTPEQQQAAMNAYTQGNARQLQQYGIEATPANLANAHLLGATGLQRYQQSGYLSPQAIAANGGEENLRRIIAQRSAGQGGAASGAAQQAQPVAPQPQQAPLAMPANQGIKIPGMVPTAQMDTQVGQQIPSTVQTPEAIQRFQTNQDNVDELMKMRNDTTLPEYLRRRSSERAYELMNNEFKQQKAQSQVDDMLKNNDQVGLARVISSKPKDEEGSWLKMIALGFISPQLAGQEAIKLGLGPTKYEDQTLTKDDGTEVGIQLKRRADGKIVGGEYHDGTPMTAEDIQLAQTGNLGKGVHVTKVDNMVDPNNPNRIITKQELSNGKQRFMSAGKRVTEGLENLVPASQHMEQENKRVNDAYAKLKGLVANPTEEQKLQALRAAGVAQSRIDTELGRPTGATQRVAPTQPVTPQQVAQQRPPVAQAQPAPATSAQPVPTTGYATSALLQTPVQQLGEPNSTFKQREVAHDRQLKQAQKEAEGFQKSGVAIRDSLNGLQSIRQAVMEGKINAGPSFNATTGVFPAGQDVAGRLFGTEDSQNTEKLRSIIDREGLKGIKDSMGPAISNFDVQSWMKSNPIRMDSSLPAIEKWLTKTHNAMWEEANIKRNEAIAIGAIGPGDYQLPPKITAPEDNQVDTNNPLLKKKK